ncbi:MAG: hypothetical protein ABSA46_13130 [Thermodesulfovibrionales bacterium]|jgi:hypothetical protein
MPKHGLPIELPDIGFMHSRYPPGRSRLEVVHQVRYTPPVHGARFRCSCGRRLDPKRDFVANAESEKKDD